MLPPVSTCATRASSASVGALGQSVQLWGGGRVYVLGVSDTSTKSTAWSPAVAVFNNATHALVDTGSFGTASYPVGHTVHESIYYNMTTGDLSFTVQDITSSMAATSNTFTMNVGTGVNFTQARIGTEFGDTPWSAPAFTAPASRQKTATFFNGALTNYVGHRYGLTGYWANTPLVMTGPGSVVEADAGPIVNNAFSAYLEPSAVIEGGIRYPGPGSPGPGYRFGLFHVGLLAQRRNIFATRPAASRPPSRR